MRSFLFRRLRRHLLLFVLSALLFPATFPVFAQQEQQLGGGIGSDLDPATRLELEYARLLMEEGMPDYAEIVVSRIQHPDARILIEVIKVQALIATGEFDKVKAIIKAKPDQRSEKVWAMKLALADGYYAWAKYPEAQAVYKEFFDAYPNGPPEALFRFYLESAYKFAQMMLAMGKRDEAIKAYGQAVKTIPKNDRDRRGMRRQLLGEMGDLLIKQAEEDPENRSMWIKKAKDVLNDLYWVQDVWFGKAVVMEAHIKMLQKDAEGAKKLLDKYTPQLQEIDQALAQESEESGDDLMKLSPMAECRYLLARILDDAGRELIAAGNIEGGMMHLLGGKAQKLPDGRVVAGVNGAVQHYVNVYVQYPQTQWAPDCDKRIESIRELVQKYGKDFKYPITPEQKSKVELEQFRAARAFYAQRQWDKAIDAYLDVLNRFPDSETAVPALGELAECYLEVQTEYDPMMDMNVDVVLRYLAERFCKDRDVLVKAGNQLLKIALMYEERKMNERRDQIYEYFFHYFTKHPRAAVMLYQFGKEKLDADDVEGAMVYFGRITNDYQEASIYPDALAKVASCQAAKEDRLGEIATLTRMIEVLSEKDHPGYQVINAKYRIASSQRSMSYNLRKQMEGAEDEAEMGKLYKESYGYLVKALTGFTSIIKELNDPEKKREYYKTAEEEEAVNMILEGGMFFRANSCAMVPSKDEAKEKQFKLLAIKYLDELLEKYPKSKFGPSALSMKASLQIVLEDPKGAELSLRQLKRSFPNSKEAKDADYALAMALLEMGKKQQAIRYFRKMFEGEGEFSSGKILTAGRQLLDAEEYDIAADAFEQVLAKTDDAAEKAVATVGRGTALVKQGEYKEGIKLLEDFMEKNPQSGRTIKIAILLSDAYNNLAASEKDAARRRELFDKCVSWLKEARKHLDPKKTPGPFWKSTVDVCRINEFKARAEEKFGDEAKAKEYRGKAIASYLSVLFNAPTGNEDVRPHLDLAFYECVDLMYKIGSYEDAADQINRYFELFPAGLHLREMRRLRAKTNSKLLTMGKDINRNDNEAEGGDGATEEEVAPKEAPAEPPADAEPPPAGAPAEKPAEEPAAAE